MTVYQQDIYLFSSYKTYGPHQGIMVIKESLAELLPNQGHYFNEKFLTKKFTPAGPDHAQIAACAGIVEYFDALASHHGVALSDAPSGVHKLFWAIKGELFLNCSCTVFCPCVVSLGAHPPTEGHCHAWMAIAIDEGYYEEENLAGIDVELSIINKS